MIGIVKTPGFNLIQVFYSIPHKDVKDVTSCKTHSKLFKRLTY